MLLDAGCRAHTHPASDLDQTLPEGALRNFLTGVYAKITSDMGDFEMLCVLAGEAIGRVRVVPRGATPSATRDNTFELNALLTAVDSYPVMAALTHDMAKYSSVAGVQLKVLASGVLNIRTESVPRPGITDQWIVKPSGNDFPWLAANEFLCMSAAAKCGLRVPNVHLSEDHQILLVERFDLDPDGNSESVQRTFDKVFLAVDDLSIDVANYSNEDEDFERRCGAPMMASLIRGMRRAFHLNSEFMPSGLYLMMRALPLD